MSKFDEMISGQGILSRKKKEVEMSTIRTLVNDVTCGRCNEEREIETQKEMKQSRGKRLYLLTIIGRSIINCKPYLKVLGVWMSTFKEMEVVMTRANTLGYES